MTVPKRGGTSALTPREFAVEFAVGDLVRVRHRGIVLHDLGEALVSVTGLASRSSRELRCGEVGVVIGTRRVTDTLQTASIAKIDRPMLDVVIAGDMGSLWPHDLDIVVQARPPG